MKRQCDSVRDGDLVAYLSNPDDDSLRDVHRHVTACRECTAELQAWRALRGDLLMDEGEVWDDHPPEDNLVAFSDDPSSLGPALRTEIEAHLTNCAMCRDEIRVLGDMRIERAAVEQNVREARAVASPAATVERDLLPDPAVIEAMTIGQRLRHPGVAFAIFFVLSVPVLGLLAVETGLVPTDSPGLSESSTEIEFDPLTLTARPADDVASADRRDSDSVASASSVVALQVGGPDGQGHVAPSASEAPRGALVQELDAVAKKEEAVQRSATPQQLAAAYDRVAAPPFSTQVAQPAESSAEAEESLPLSSATETRLTPEQLMAMLETERMVAEMRERAIEIPDEVDTTPSGAAIVETIPGGELDDAADLRTTPDGAPQAAPVRSARVAPESMIIGVRKLGTAPVRGVMRGMGASSESGAGADGGPATASRAAGWGKARLHFVRGSSYVFTRDEVYRGMEVRFPLPMRDGEVRGVDARLIEVGGGREIRRTFVAPDPPVQTAPAVSLDVPAGWLSAGRYAVELTAIDGDADTTESVHIRVLDPPTARPRTADRAESGDLAAPAATLKE